MDALLQRSSRDRDELLKFGAVLVGSHRKAQDIPCNFHVGVVNFSIHVALVVRNVALATRHSSSYRIKSKIQPRDFPNGVFVKQVGNFRRKDYVFCIERHTLQQI